jgi:mannose-1-phosphate guanylyltransferase/mannose-1-phosphate guanylyltransferase/mannose-6-phosphate isomerase
MDGDNGSFANGDYPACMPHRVKGYAVEKGTNIVRGVTPVILCGGSGTRLWPRSRNVRPKPFIPLVGEGTLFEQAIMRCQRADGFDAPIIVAGQAHVDYVEAQLGAVDATIIVEPVAKNTAAAIALAALRLPEDSVMLVCPSDHHIGDPAAFAAAARAATSLASQGWLVSFGIEAKSPETGFGYLLRGEPIGDAGFRVARFVEKPDLATARAYLADGNYAWNGGIFAFRVRDFLAELARHRPAIATLARRAVEKGREEGHHFYPDAETFAAIEGESVDYAVMENTDRAAMVPAEMAWSDIGSWSALHAARTRGHSENSVSGPVELVNCRNVLVDTDGPRVSVIGLEDIIVVVDGDEVLVTTMAGAQRVGKLAGAANQ